MLQETADVPAGHVGQAGVAGLVEEQRLAALPQRLVHVHARAVVLEDRLRHERHRVAGGVRHVLDDVLVEHELVGHRQQRVEAHVDLGLAGGAHLVVLHLDLDAQLLERQDHLRAEVLEAVHWRDGEVPLLVAGLVPEVRAAVELELATRVPHALDRVDVVVARVLVLVEASRVEDVELRFGPDVDGVGDARALDVLLRLLRDVARVAGVRLARDRVFDVTVDGERRVLAERVDDRRVRVGDQEHVGLLDLLEAADRRAVEPVALVEAVRRQLVDRHREVLHEPGEVTEPEVHDLGARVLGQLQHVARGALLRHFVSFVRGRTHPVVRRGRRLQIGGSLCPLPRARRGAGRSPPGARSQPAISHPLPPNERSVKRP